MIQIIGKSGMLGIEVARSAIESGIEVYDQYVDIESVNSDDIKCDIVINCSGISPDSHNKERAASVNRFGPIKLSKACDEKRARLIHISSDAVFNNPGPHSERSLCSPTSSYGRIKMKGEIKYVPHLTIRTSFIGFGRRGLICQLTTTDDIITASKLFLWSGHTAAAAADAIVKLAMHHAVTGLIHIPGEFQTRYDLVEKLINLFDLDPNRLVRDDSWISDRRLISSRWRAIGMPQMPSFDDQLDILISQYKSRSNDNTVSREEER